MQPNPHKSDPILGSLLFKISGATNCAVPTKELRRRGNFSASCNVSVDVSCTDITDVDELSKILAVPKSVIFMWNFSSSKIFSGFRSLKFFKIF